jgi:hypothetical protein
MSITGLFASLLPQQANPLLFLSKQANPLLNQLRCFSATPALCLDYPEGHPMRKKVDFGTLRLYNKRHLRVHKKEMFTKFEFPRKHLNIPVHHYGCRGTGVRHHGGWEHIPEKVPQLIVPGKQNFSQAMLTL